MDSGLTSTRGSVSSTKWTAAELLDTVARHGVDGERGYGERVAAMASAMAWESEGEELRRERRVCELGGGVGDRSRAAALRGEEAGRRAAAWRAQAPASSTWLHAWASQAAR